MAVLYWLDDNSNQPRKATTLLEANGHEVQLFEREEDLIALLDSGDRPDLLIQDLLRPRCLAQIRSGLPRKGAHSAYEAGWSLYEEVLRPSFPEVPVLICSHDVGARSNRDLADDFNLVLVDKKDSLGPLFLNAVAALLEAQRRVHETSLILSPSIQVDFDEISSHLIDYLARHPQELHKVSWANFERLVAELLRRMGYEVHHTRLTRDHGVDVWAIRRDDLAETLYAIDAKKYDPDTSVIV